MHNQEHFLGLFYIESISTLSIALLRVEMNSLLQTVILTLLWILHYKNWTFNLKLKIVVIMRAHNILNENI